MNARLLILGVLHRGDFHPYEIKRRLEAAMVECYVDVDVGTLYYAVRQLEKDGLISAVAQERVARGGMRTIYRITPGGEPSSATACTGNSTRRDRSRRHSIARCFPCISRIAPSLKTASAAGSRGWTSSSPS